ncbi:transposase [Streptomyces sp. NPDC007355]|uniref:transposase n=1 Tax=Streptomyces sp. NPDC007355 TaxID=3364778 RepID=UPI0036BF1BBB
MTDEKLGTEAASAAVDGRFVEEFVSRAQAEGLRLTGGGGLLRQLTERLLGSALEGEMTGHLGYDQHDPAGKKGSNSRNGERTKTVVTDVGPVTVEVPRDRASAFERKIVRQHQWRLTGVDEMVLSLSAKGLTDGEISSHLAEATVPARPGRPSPRSRTRPWRAWPNGRPAARPRLPGTTAVSVC